MSHPLGTVVQALEQEYAYRLRRLSEADLKVAQARAVIDALDTIPSREPNPGRALHWAVTARDEAERIHDAAARALQVATEREINRPVKEIGT